MAHITDEQYKEYQNDPDWIKFNDELSEKMREIYELVNTNAEKYNSGVIMVLTALNSDGRAQTGEMVVGYDGEQAEILANRLAQNEKLREIVTTAVHAFESYNVIKSLE